MSELIHNTMQFIASLFAATAIHSAAPAATADLLPLQHSIPGGLMVIPLTDAVQAPEVTFNKQQVMVLRPDEQQPWMALVGIPLSQKTGPASINSGDEQIRFEVRDHPYPEQHLTVKKKHVNPSAAELARIRKEQAQMARVYTSFSPARPWQPMAWPVSGTMSSAFGLKRFFNGEQRSPHSGLDIAAPTGTPILAPADGKVVLTGNFFFNGNSVFIDHGQGLISMFCHMSAIDVQEGDEVSAGSLLGKVGATGRATGPHLHWTVSLNNARINPLLLMSPLRGGNLLSAAANGGHHGG